MIVNVVIILFLGYCFLKLFYIVIRLYEDVIIAYKISK